MFTIECKVHVIFISLCCYMVVLTQTICKNVAKNDKSLIFSIKSCDCKKYKVSNGIEILKLLSM